MAKYSVKSIQFLSSQNLFDRLVKFSQNFPTRLARLLQTYLKMPKLCLSELSIKKSNTFKSIRSSRGRGSSHGDVCLCFSQ